MHGGRATRDRAARARAATASGQETPDEIALIEQRKLDDARMLLNTSLSLQGDLMDMQVQLLRELNKQGAAAAVSGAGSRFQQTRIIAVSAIVVALVLTLLLAWRLSVRVIASTSVIPEAAANK